MPITSIKPTNILSFGENQPPIELAPLNILVGPNGSGKSNLIECVRLLQSTSQSPPAPPRNWLWQGSKMDAVARLEAVVDYPAGSRNLRYWLEFTAKDDDFQLTDERIENEHPDPGHGKAYFYFAYQNGWPVINVKNVRRQLKRDDINTELSILAQRKYPDTYPEISWLADAFRNIRIYRNWTFGTDTPLRTPQKLGKPDEFLEEGLENLGTILNFLCGTHETKQIILGHLGKVLPTALDIKVDVIEDNALILVQEAEFVIPADRLSDGTLRFLCLLAILCHPSPPPLICIDEPELGLNPEMIASLAELLSDASQRTQLIVTTHSDLLVEEFIATPEKVITFERHEGQTFTNRLDAEGLANWLDTFTLGPK